MVPLMLIDPVFDGPFVSSKRELFPEEEFPDKLPLILNCPPVAAKSITLQWVKADGHEMFPVIVVVVPVAPVNVTARFNREDAFPEVVTVMFPTIFADVFELTQANPFE